MKIAGQALLMCTLAGCAPLGRSSSIQRFTIHGPHTIEFTLPGQLTRSALTTGLPPITFFGPSDLSVVGLVFDDANGDARCGSDEFVVRFRGRSGIDHVILESVRISSAELERFRGDARLGCEIEADGQRHWHSQLIE